MKFCCMLHKSSQALNVWVWYQWYQSVDSVLTCFAAGSSSLTPSSRGRFVPWLERKEMVRLLKWKGEMLSIRHFITVSNLFLLNSNVLWIPLPLLHCCLFNFFKCLGVSFGHVKKMSSTLFEEESKPNNDSSWSCKYCFSPFPLPSTLPSTQ